MFEGLEGREGVGAGECSAEFVEEAGVWGGVGEKVEGCC